MKIKIAILLPSMNIGGAEKLVIEELSQLMHDERFHFEVHLVFDEGVLFEELKATGVAVKMWHTPHKSWKIPLSFWKIGRYLHAQNFDILNIHLLYQLGFITGLSSSIPTVATIHNISFQRLEKFFFRFYKYMLGCGHQVTTMLKRDFPRNTIIKIPNATSIGNINKKKKLYLEEQYKLNNSSFVICSIGRLTHAKGYDVLVDAFKTVHESCPDAILLIAGSGPDHEQLQRIINNHDLSEKIYLLGAINFVAELLETADCYVNSSRWEGLPLTLIEAISHSLPIVATDVGGNSEVVIDGETGFLVTQDSAVQLSQKLLALEVDPKLRERMSQSAYKLYKAEFTIETHCAKLADFYMKISKTQDIQNNRNQCSLPQNEYGK